MLYMAKYYSLEILGINSSMSKEHTVLTLQVSLHMFFYPTCQNETILGEDENANRLK